MNNNTSVIIKIGDDHIWFIHPKIRTSIKGLKLKISKLLFHLLLIFEDGSPIGLLLHACAHVYSFIAFGNQRIVSPIEKV
jgi:hypothetical protein